MEQEPPDQPEQRETISALDPSLPSVPPAQADMTSPPTPPRSARPFILLAVGVVAVAIAAAYSLGRRGEAPPPPDPTATKGLPTQQSTRLATAAGCTPVAVFSNLDVSHVEAPETVEYATEPAMGGPHYGQWANTGVHADEVPAEMLAHNMEHGHVIVWYDPRLPGHYLDALVPIVERHATGVVLTPRAQLGPAGVAVAFTSWGRLSTCAVPTTPAAVGDFAEDFVRTYGANGPEGFIAGDPA